MQHLPTSSFEHLVILTLDGSEYIQDNETLTTRRHSTLLQTELTKTFLGMNYL